MNKKCVFCQAPLKKNQNKFCSTAHHGEWRTMMCHGWNHKPRFKNPNKEILYNPWLTSADWRIYWGIKELQREMMTEKELRIFLLCEKEMRKKVIHLLKRK